MDIILARPSDPRLAPGLFLAEPTECVLRIDGSLWPADALDISDIPAADADPAPPPAPIAAAILPATPPIVPSLPTAAPVAPEAEPDLAEESTPSSEEA